MKKRPKPKSPVVPEKIEPDIASLIIKVQQQLVFLEKKIDTLIIRIPEKTFEPKDQAKPLHHPSQPCPQGEVKQANTYRERVLHKAICADCNKECEVPFKPNIDRPVYCKECFSRRKASSPFRINSGNRPVKAGPAPENAIRKNQSAGSQKGAEKSIEKAAYKKKPASKKQKKRP